MTQQNKVRIENYYGKTVIATVLEEVHSGILNGWNYLQMPDGEKRYMARRWCRPITDNGCVSLNNVEARTDDTDWRKFLREHWDKEHNHCKVECLDEFMTIFTRAAAAYMRGKAIKPALPTTPTPPIPRKKKPHYVQLSLFD